jgi:hypothetical protein
MTGTEVNDAKSAHSNAAWAIDKDAFVVRPTVPDEVAHGPHVRNLRAVVPEEKSSNPTHGI